MNSDSLLREAVNDAQYILKYASEKGILLGDTIIASFIESWKKDAVLSSAEEATFWKSSTEANRLIAPATIESIKTSCSPCRSAPFPSRQFFLDSLQPPRRTVSLYRAGILLCLLTIASFQYFVSFGIGTIKSIEDLTSSLNAVTLEMYAANNTGDDSSQATIKRNLYAKRDNLLYELDAKYAILTSWNEKLKSILPFDVSQTSPSSQQDNKGSVSDASTQKLAQSLAIAYVNAINSYIMPLFFALLGSFAYILRDLSAKLKNDSYVTRNNIGYSIRWMLGAVAGASIGYVLTPTSIATISTSITPFGLAFFMGYSVEVVFRILDVFIEKMTFKAPTPPSTPT